MDKNPWEVDSIQAFLCLKCPECIFDAKEEDIFQDHAIENHPLSHLLFSKIIKEDEIEIKEELSEINSNTNDNEKVFEEDQKLLEEIMPCLSENSNLETFQRFVFETESSEDLNFFVPFEENQNSSGEIMPDLSENSNLENFQRLVFETESSEDQNFVAPFEENQKTSGEIMPDLRENSNSENTTIETDDDSIPSFDEENIFIQKNPTKITKLSNKTDLSEDQKVKSFHKVKTKSKEGTKKGLKTLHKCSLCDQKFQTKQKLEKHGFTPCLAQAKYDDVRYDVFPKYTGKTRIFEEQNVKTVDKEKTKSDKLRQKGSEMIHNYSLCNRKCQTEQKLEEHALTPSLSQAKYGDIKYDVFPKYTGKKRIFEERNDKSVHKEKTESEKLSKKGPKLLHNCSLSNRKCQTEQKLEKHASTPCLSQAKYDDIRYDVFPKYAGKTRTFEEENVKSFNKDKTKSEKLTQKGPKILHICSLCDKKCETEQKLKIHATAFHERKKPYHCTQCNKSYSTPSKLAYHFKTVHESIKPYQCSACDSQFKSITEITDHISSVHEGKNSHKCSSCSSSFSQMPELRTHISRVHDGKKSIFNCTLCQLHFSRKGDLKRHVQQVHEKNKPHKCSICESSFPQKSLLKKHISLVHDNAKPFKRPLNLSDYTSVTKEQMKRYMEKHGEKEL